MDQLKGSGNEAAPLSSSENIRYMLENTCFDIKAFLDSLTKDRSTAYVFFGDVQKNIYYISDNLRDRFGFSGNIVQSLLTCWEDRIFCSEGLDYYRRSLRRLLEQKEDTIDLRFRVRDKNGEVLWVRCCGSLKWSEDRTQPLFFSGRITMQDDLYFVDPVSNLPGSSTLLHRLELIRQKKVKTPVLGFCLNHLEKINALQGRTYGNRLIHDIAYELQSELGTKWFFCRLDGLRFAAVSKEPGCQVREGLEEIRALISRGYQKMGVPLEGNCAFAVSEYPAENMTALDFQENLITLIRYARAHPELDFMDNGLEHVYHRQVMANSEILLYQDVKNGMSDFRPVIQPVVDAVTGEILGGETLLRWRCGGRDVSPAVFIPLLEKGPLIHTAGRWIFEQAVGFCSRAVKERHGFYLNVNVSLQQLGDTGLLDFMEQCLHHYGLSGQHICVELTESCMDQEPEKLTCFVRGCEALGISIALDDFGSGYSSIRVLMKYPSKVIKLDRSLLLEMTESEDKLNFISSIVFACHSFGKRVCIEGVETDKQRDMAVEAGCDMIQGFYYYRPQELEAMAGLLHRKDRDTPDRQEHG